MASYQAIMIIVALFIFGLLYSALYDAADMVQDHQFNYMKNFPNVTPITPDGKTIEIMDTTSKTIKIIWKYLPLSIILMLGIYGIAVTQKGR